MRCEVLHASLGHAAWSTPKSCAGEGGAERFFRDDRPLSFPGLRCRLVGRPSCRELAAWTVSSGGLAEFPEDDYSQVNFWLSKIRNIDVEGGGRPFLFVGNAKSFDNCLDLYICFWVLMAKRSMASPARFPDRGPAGSVGMPCSRCGYLTSRPISPGVRSTSRVLTLAL